MNEHSGRNAPADGAELDLDEDLFDFGEMQALDELDEVDEDLDEIFAAFQEMEDADEDLDLDAPAERLEETAPTPATAPAPLPPRLTPAQEAHTAQAPTLDTPERLHPPTKPEPALFDGRGATPADLRQPGADPRDLLEPVAAAAGRPPGGSRNGPPALPVPGAKASRLLAGPTVWILLALTCLNGLVAVMSIRNSAVMRDSMLEVSLSVRETAEEIRTDAHAQATAISHLRTPIVPTDPEEHPTFDRAREDITAGRYDQARQRLYSLLAVIDRLEEQSRETVESRVQYLLAEATHLEALSRMDGRP